MQCVLACSVANPDASLSFRPRSAASRRSLGGRFATICRPDARRWKQRPPIFLRCCFSHPFFSVPVVDVDCNSETFFCAEEASDCKAGSVASARLAGASASASISTVPSAPWRVCNRLVEVSYHPCCPLFWSSPTSHKSCEVSKCHTSYRRDLFFISRSAYVRILGAKTKE